MGKVEYASANKIDVDVLKGNLIGAGWPMPFPFTLGYDLAGTVVTGAGDFKEGQRVFAVNFGQGIMLVVMTPSGVPLQSMPLFLLQN